MVQGSDSSEVALLSIHPKYAKAILSGDKKVEFRKQPFRKGVSIVVIYATAPVSQVIGFFTVKGIHVSTPTEIWNRFSSVGEISRKEYREYYSGKESAVAIQIEEARAFSSPIDLSEMKAVAAPPQNFVYLCNKSRDVLWGERAPSEGAS